MIVQKYYENLNVLHENTMPHRAYYMPASKAMGSLVHDRENSDRMELLNGNWKFRFYKSIYDLQEKFYEAGYDVKEFDEIPVPGIWQNYGYDSHQYTNVRYPIPLDPPYVPQENPCGAYVHQFEYHKDSQAPKAYVNFEGVDSCFYVWMNGAYVGYSQVTHATSEFDVTSFVHEGMNTLAVLVLKWCDGTYLEDQDKFRMTGIFRDVYLLKRPENVLYDYFTTTSVKENTAEIEIRANFLGGEEAAKNTKIVIQDDKGNPVIAGTFTKCDAGNFAYKAVFDIADPKLWNPEEPYLYQSENGKGIYYYGGDHGEEIHDGNFCMDGLVYPDRSAHTGLKEYKNVYRPARVISYDQVSGKAVLHNYMNYVDLKDYLYLSYEVTVDGKMVNSGCIRMAEGIAPQNEGTIIIPADVQAKGKCYLKVNYLLKAENNLQKADTLLGFDEILLFNEDGRNQKALQMMEEGLSEDKLKVTDTDRYLTIENSEFCYVYNKLTGLFEDMKAAGENLLDRPMEINIWRAPTDNDRKIKLEWMDAHYDQSYARAYETTYEAADTKVTIHTHMAVVAATVQKVLDIRADWEVSANGAVSVKMNAAKDMEFPMLPRFGLRMFLNNGFNKVSYYGIGPDESYRDKCRAGSHGVYTALVEDMHEDFLRPQENGSHADCDYVCVNSEKMSLAFAGEKAIAFNASVYTQEELTNKKHSYELEKCGSTVLCIDYAQNGIGSNSCGPKLSEKYRLNEENFTFCIKMVLLKK